MRVGPFTITVRIRLRGRTRLARLICRLTAHRLDEDGECLRCDFVKPYTPSRCPNCQRERKEGWWVLAVPEVCECGWMFPILPSRIRDLFPTFGTARGSITFVRPPDLSDRP